MRMAWTTIRSSSSRALVALALLCCTPAAEAPAAPAPAAPAAKKGSMSKYDEAVGLLASPNTWCAGAKALVALKDARALVPIVQAYERPAEAEKGCLADALEALGGEAGAKGLLASKDAAERAAGAKLTILFASDAQVPLLVEVALGDPDAGVRTKALDALRQQHQSAAWEAAVAALLDKPDAALRGWAIDRLVAHDGESSRAKLRAHLPHETDAALHARIEAGLKK